MGSTNQLMKMCPWCGKEYPDEVSNCAIDQYLLEPREPAAAPPVSEREESEAEEVESPALIQKAEDEGAPDGFQSPGAFVASDAERLLMRLSEANIQFKIDQLERRGRVAGAEDWISQIIYIKIFVHNDGYEKAFPIVSEGWKV